MRRVGGSGLLQCPRDARRAARPAMSSTVRCCARPRARARSSTRVADTLQDARMTRRALAMAGCLRRVPCHAARERRGAHPARCCSTPGQTRPRSKVCTGAGRHPWVPIDLRPACPARCQPRRPRGRTRGAWLPPQRQVRPGLPAFGGDRDARHRSRRAGRSDESRRRGWVCTIPNCPRRPGRPCSTRGTCRAVPLTELLPPVWAPSATPTLPVRRPSSWPGSADPSFIRDERQLRRLIDILPKTHPFPPRSRQPPHARKAWGMSGGEFPSKQSMAAAPPCAETPSISPRPSKGATFAPNLKHPHHRRKRPTFAHKERGRVDPKTPKSYDFNSAVFTMSIRPVTSITYYTTGPQRRAVNTNPHSCRAPLQNGPQELPRQFDAKRP